MTANAPTCFVSHSHSDKRFARTLARDLEGQGLKAWLDEWEIKGGDSISDAVQSALDTYDVFIIVLSPRAVASQWVKEELRVALQRCLENTHNVIIPVLRKNCTIPTFLRDYKYIRFARSSDYVTAFTQLLDSIVFRDPFAHKFKKAYVAKMVINSVAVVARITGSKQQLFVCDEIHTVIPIVNRRTLAKEMQLDGKLLRVDLSCGTVKSERIRASTLRWLLQFSPSLKARIENEYTLHYEIANEFNIANSWYYRIESPVKRISFRFSFSDECAPTSLVVTEKQAVTRLRPKILKGRRTRDGKVFAIHRDFPGYLKTFEFTWK